MTHPLGIYQIANTQEFVVAEERGGMFMTSETLDIDDISDLAMGQMESSDYELTPERSRPVHDFTEIPFEAWADIAGVELDTAKGQG